MANSPMQTKAHFVVRYMWGTTVGWILAVLSIFPAFGIWEIIAAWNWQHARETLWYELWGGWLGDVVMFLLTVATFLLMGTSIGLAQWQIALRAIVGKRVWLLSCLFTVATGVIGLLAAIYIAPPLFTVHPGVASGLDTRLTLNTTWAIAVIVLGGISGFAIGLPQWLVLRRHFYIVSGWLLATTIGGFALFAAYAAIIFVVKNNVISWGLACLASPIVFGGVTGITLYSLLKRPKLPLS